MRLSTIGFSGKSAENFFTILAQTAVEKLIDIRRSNNTLYSGFTRARDLPFLLGKICGVTYVYVPDFAPSLGLLRWYQARLKKNKRDPKLWPEYVRRFTVEIAKRPIMELFQDHTAGLERVCFLCTEPTADRCHRRLLAEYVAEQSKRPIEVIHL